MKQSLVCFANSFVTTAYEAKGYLKFEHEVRDRLDHYGFTSVSPQKSRNLEPFEYVYQPYGKYGFPDFIINYNHNDVRMECKTSKAKFNSLKKFCTVPPISNTFILYGNGQHEFHSIVNFDDLMKFEIYEEIQNFMDGMRVQQDIFNKRLRETGEGWGITMRYGLTRAGGPKFSERGFFEEKAFLRIKKMEIGHGMSETLCE